MSIDKLTMTEIAEGFERMFERAAGTAVCGCGKVLRGARRRFCAECFDRRHIARSAAYARRKAAL